MEIQGKDSRPDRPQRPAREDPFTREDSAPALSSPGLAYWCSAIVAYKEIAPKDMAFMIAQPRFADACRNSIRSSTVRHGRNRLLTRVTRDISRLIYGYIVLYLDARGGITLSAIQELSREIGLASPGRAQAILFHLRAIGYIKTDPASTDRRSRRYVPSLEMRGSFREVLADELRAFSLIEPDAGIAADRLIEPEFFRAFMVRFGRGILVGLQTKPARVITHFAEPNAGLIILWDILSSAQEGDCYPPRGPLKMSVTELSQKYGVSRSHVFRLLRDAEKLGLLKRNADEQTGTITDVLARDVAEFQVAVFLGLAACCQAAFQMTAAARLQAE
jgi:DNA-binding MarR family transcriptional regulator